MSPIPRSTLFALSPNAYMLVDRNLVYLDANPAYERLAGRRREDLIGRPLFEMFPGDPLDPRDTSADELRASLRHVLERREPHHVALIRYPIPRVTPQGTVYDERYWSATHTPVLDGDGEVAAILQHTTEVTELHRLREAAGNGLAQLEGGVLARAQAVQSANRALDAQQRHLRQLFDQAPGFLCVLRGPQHVYELVNEAYYAVAGRRAVVGRPIREALPELAGQGYFELLDRVYATGEPYVGHGARVLLRREDSPEPAERYVDFIYQPLVADGGTITGVLVQGHDVTEQVVARRAAERYRLQLEEVLRERTQELEASLTGHAETRAQLLHVQKLEALGRLTGGVAHDFNNLLQVISNSLLILQGVSDGSPEVERWIGVARHAVKGGASLTAQLLAFARRQPLSPRSINLSHLLQGMSDLIRRAIGEAIEVTVDFAPGLWNTYADPHQLENVILNLSLNARDAIGERGRLMLAAGNGAFAPDEADGPAGDCVWLSVTDTGHGMAPEVLARAFEPFFTTKADGRGTGLGLSMVYGFARQSGGQIAIDSEPGRGTTVTVRLPRARESEERRALEALGPVPGGRETLLVVEDDEAVRASTTAALAELGYRVLAAPDAASALRVLQRDDSIDLLFTDVVMPGPLNSTQLVEQARQLRPGLQVLFTSGYADDRIGPDGRIDPSLPLIPKPYERDDLARRIRQLLDVEPAPPSDWSEADLQLSVLFVDDDEDLQYVGAEVLRMMGNEVHTAASAEEALELLRARHFDVLVTDVGLPGMSGIALAALARERAPALKVVLASGYGRSALPDGDRIREHTVLLPKPYSPEAMAQALRRACSDG